MHGIVAAQLREQRTPDVVLVEAGVAHVDRRKVALQRLWLGHRLAPSLRRLRAIGSGKTIEGEAAVSKARGNPFRHAGK